VVLTKLPLAWYAVSMNKMLDLVTILGAVFLILLFLKFVLPILEPWLPVHDI
jgi:hypothetical protein